MGSYIARVYSSERVSSSHGPDIFYEFVHAHVKHDPAQAVGADVVIIRMVQGDRGDLGIVPEIHVQDLMEVEERFMLFMDRVRKKSGDTATLPLQHPGSQVSPVPGVPVLPAQMPPMQMPPVQVVLPMMPQMAAAPAPAPTPAPAPVPVPAAAPAPEPEPMGRYAPGAPRKKVGGLPEGMMSMGPKKSSFALGPGGQVVGKAPGEGSSTWRAPGDTGSEGGMTGYEILPFTLQKPPDLDQVMRLLANDPQRLVVVARMELTDKIKTYLDNVIKGDGTLAQKPGAFSAIVVTRQGGKMNFKQKMQGPVALALQQIVANPTKVLWVPPEGA